MAYLISVVAITIAFSSAFTSAAPTTSAAAAITPSVKSVQLLGFANDTSFNAALYRDGGGGGMTGSGINVVCFSDTLTYNGPNGTSSTFQSSPNGSLSANNDGFAGIWHNTCALMNKTNPTSLYDFGDRTSASNGYFPGPVLGPNSSYENAIGGDNFRIWPNNNLLGSLELTVNQLIGVFQASNAASGDLYTSLATIDVSSTLPNGQVLPAYRNVTSLFYANETLSYTFGLYANATVDGYLYIFGRTNSSTGMRLARVPTAQMTQRSSYTFWTGATWSSSMPIWNNTASQIITFPWGIDYAGDIFYSPYFQAPVLIVMHSYTFYICVAVSSTDLTKGFSAPIKIYTPDWLSNISGDYTYAFHAYPHMDPTGKTLLLSWAEEARYIRMATVTWN